VKVDFLVFAYDYGVTVLASALMKGMKGIHPLKIFKMADIQGLNASHKRTG
jgi:hypothetical protein